jgi:hypothetical protein
MIPFRKVGETDNLFKNRNVYLRMLSARTAMRRELNPTTVVHTRRVDSGLSP